MMSDWFLLGALTVFVIGHVATILIVASIADDLTTTAEELTRANRGA